MDHAARVWDIVEETCVGMLTTRFAGGLRARPLEARPDRVAGDKPNLGENRNVTVELS